MASNGGDELLDAIEKYAIEHNRNFELHSWQFLPDELKNRYTRIKFVIDRELFLDVCNWKQFNGYLEHPPLDYQNFACSFNGDRQIGRMLLTSALNRYGWFNPEYCSKNFTIDPDELHGSIMQIAPDKGEAYSRILVKDSDLDFFNSVYSINFVKPEDMVRGVNGRWMNAFDRHKYNIDKLANKITKCFVNIVSETRATSNIPAPTEKPLYSVLTRGLFVGYASPGWHQYLEEMHGFKRFTKIFDYSFDYIRCPIERLFALLGMLNRYANLSMSDLRDLYEIEKDTIEHNYDMFVSGEYIKYIYDRSWPGLPKN